MKFRCKYEELEILSSRTDYNTVAIWNVLRYICKSGNEEYLSMLPGIEKMLLDLGDIKANFAFAEAVEGASIYDQIDLVINSGNWDVYGNHLLLLASLKGEEIDYNRIADTLIKKGNYWGLLDLVGHVDGVDRKKAYVFLRACGIDVKCVEDYYFGSGLWYVFSESIEEDTPRIRNFIDGYKEFLEFVDKFELGEIIESNKDVISRSKEPKGEKI